MSTHRQLVMASPSGGGAAGANTTFTITCSEPGILHADGLVLGSAASSGINTPSADLVPTGAVTSVLAYNAIELVRGRNTVTVPSGAFSAYRGINSVRLGDWKMQAGDTFAVTFDEDGDETAAYLGSIAAPFSPAMSRGGVPEPNTPCTYAGSPVLDLSADGQGNATLTFDEDGIFSLASLQSRVMLDLTAAAGAAVGPWIDGSVICDITGITLPSGNALIIGQNTPACPAAFFASAYRKYSFADLGSIPVSAGDTIVVSYDNNETQEGAVASFGGRFYPAAPVARAGRC